jgi:hypothetical protein
MSDTLHFHENFPSSNHTDTNMIPRGAKWRNPGQARSPIGTPLGYFPRDFRLERSIRIGTLYFLSWDLSISTSKPSHLRLGFRLERFVRVGTALGVFPSGFRSETFGFWMSMLHFHESFPSSNPTDRPSNKHKSYRAQLRLHVAKNVAIQDKHGLLGISAQGTSDSNAASGPGIPRPGFRKIPAGGFLFTSFGRVPTRTQHPDRDTEAGDSETQCGPSRLHINQQERQDDRNKCTRPPCVNPCSWTRIFRQKMASR